MSLFTLLLVMGFAQAGDVSCQVDVLKPKMNATVIDKEAEKPATITVAEARIRLQARQETPQKDTALTEQEKQAEKEEPAKKESGMGSMFDILLPSKLRNPVQK